MSEQQACPLIQEWFSAWNDSTKQVERIDQCLAKFVSWGLRVRASALVTVKSNVVSAILEKLEAVDFRSVVPEKGPTLLQSTASRPLWARLEDLTCS